LAFNDAGLAPIKDLLLTQYQPITEIRSEEDLVGPGAAPGTVPTDLEQATGLERLEILGKMAGVDIFDMRPLDSSRKGAHHTMQYFASSSGC